MSVAECESKAVNADTKNLDSKHRDIHTIYYLLINSAKNILLSHPSKQTPQTSKSTQPARSSLNRFMRIRVIYTFIYFPVYQVVSYQPDQSVKHEIDLVWPKLAMLVFALCLLVYRRTETCSNNYSSDMPLASAQWKQYYNSMGCFCARGGSIYVCPPELFSDTPNFFPKPLALSIAKH